MQELTRPAETVVATRSLRKQFGDTTALAGVDLDVRRGELVVLLGLSGSGKSTLLRCLNGLHDVTSGEITVLGRRVDTARSAELRRLRTEIGFVFQQFNLVGRLSCLENVLTGALGRVTGPRYGVLSWSKALRRDALDHLDRVGLADRAFQRADTLSGGQQQRVAIARTLMQKPTLLLADEPVASLDPENSQVVMDLLLRVCREDDLTVVCTLHQVDLALGWAGRLVGLRQGVKVLDRPTAGLGRDEVMDVYRRVDPDAA
ncbi:phosphonate ABC transporter ATP-binding protein [Kribbella sp. CA-293567]|uniref:phosphonate ABC transporter ATP-binding protein n=1 Tax=Kribbella sp. CA-293567 TaxID=3002436 RepID=UPI0022DD36CC|nr:phosphonate ABC transporter ATP-binding protein [Kribbella sp. CA-293567]WBQ04422.1 phosphonate ABC transporter ATP-binding protein [Kribbella sp. CA-293567]